MNSEDNMFVFIKYLPSVNHSQITRGLVLTLSINLQERIIVQLCCMTDISSKSAFVETHMGKGKNSGLQTPVSAC